MATMLLVFVFVMSSVINFGKRMIDDKEPVANHNEGVCTEE